jgi:zinc protease
MRRKLCGIVALGCLIASPAFAALSVDTTRVGHGVRVWYASTPAVPVVSVEIAFEGGGYASDPMGKEGRAALAASMLTEGAGPYDALAFQQALEDGAISLSADSSADRLTIHIQCLREQATRAGELLALALKNPRFAPEDLARVKAETHQQLKRLQEQPGYRANRLLASHAFINHPYANPPLGTQTSLQELTPDDIRQYYATYATRSNVRIAASGDVDSGLLDDMLAPVVEALSAAEVDTTVTPANWRGAGEELHETMPVPQTSVAFAAPAIPRSDERFYAATMLNQVLGGDGLIARLARQVRQEKGLAYYVGTGIDIKRGMPLISGNFATRNESAGEAVVAVKQVLESLRSQGVTHEECEDARTYVLGSQSVQLDSSSDVATMLLVMQLYNLGEDYLEKREGYFNAVRCEQLNDLAREILNPSNFLFAVVGGKANE